MLSSAALAAWRSLPLAARSASGGARAAPSAAAVAAPTRLRAARASGDKSRDKDAKGSAGGARQRARPGTRAAGATTRPADASSFGEQLRELRAVTARARGVAAVDSGLEAAASARFFPAVRMASVGGEEVSVREAACGAPMTLVLLAFRSFADVQVASWREAFVDEFGGTGESDAQGGGPLVFDVSVNETFSAQMLSGFVQRLQRGRVADGMLSRTLALNEDMGPEIERLLPSKNRLFGYALLLDREGRVRFRAAGMATDDARAELLAAGKKLILEDAQNVARRAATGKSGTSRRSYRAGNAR